MSLSSWGRGSLPVVCTDLGAVNIVRIDKYLFKDAQDATPTLYRVSPLPVGVEWEGVRGLPDTAACVVLLPEGGGRGPLQVSSRFSNKSLSKTQKYRKEKLH